MWSLVLILTPLLAALIILIIPGLRKVKSIALTASLALLVLTCTLWFTGTGEKQYSLILPWIPSWGIWFHVGMDGISFLMVLLTNLLIPFVILSGWHKDIKLPGVFYSLILLVQFALTGVFTAKNAVLFYFFWELSLIPVFFMLFLWGGERRQSVTMKFFIYTLFGSLFLIAVFIYLYFQAPSPHSFEYQNLLNINLEPCDQYWVFWFLLLSFAIKIPLFPFHSWQPDTYTVAPVEGSMLLGGLLMKMGIYAMIRWMIPVLPSFSLQWGYWIMIFALAGMILFSVIALKQNNFKTFIAWSSLAHGGLMGAAIFSFNEYALQGVLFQSFSHGILIVLLFYFAQLIEERTQTLNMAHLGGLKVAAPRFSALMLVVFLGSIGLPLTNGFIGELLMLLGLFSYHLWAAILGGLSLVLGAVYMLYAYQKTALGPANELTAGFTDLNPRELVFILPLVALVLLTGIYPQPLLTLTEGPVKELINLAFNIH
ncbi:MAG TPA: NADH-quinone oxidoreductase subunit M [Bacteroidales bacterium]|nr:NADH-quinone oxidoreductase subunit M [Bacteroidales bacterium]HSA42324.1 NADH-quinone oxidoreductase subunit M [Bacteroidales bacterium]